MRVSCHRSARCVSPCGVLLAVCFGLNLTGCALSQGKYQSQISFDEYREYLAERAAVEVAPREEAEAPTFEDVLEAAQRQHAAGNSDRAVELYFQAFRLDPEDLRSHEGMAYLQLAREPERAEHVFRKVVESDPNSTMAYVGLGLAKFAQGDPEAAVPYLERSIELDPSSAEAHDSLAVVLQRLGRLEEGRLHAEQARELAPDDSGIANNLGISNLLLDDLESAEAAFRGAIALDPRDPAYRNNLGIALGKQGRYKDAMKAFRAAGSEQAAENNLGYIYFLNGLYEEALDHYELALQSKGDDTLKVLRNLNALLDARAAQD